VAATGEILHAKKREAVGTNACRSLRDGGDVPAVLYGHKEEPVNLQVPYEELDAALRHHSRMVELRIGRQKEPALLKEVQYDAFGMQLVHADFLRVAMDEAITLEIPIELKGRPKQEEAVLQQTLDSVEVECLPTDIPESIVGQVGDLEIGDTLHLSALEMPPKVKALTDPETVVATVTAAELEEPEEELEAAEAALAAAAGEPEVIGREEGEEEEPEAEESEQ
jgi:large subunit ribosomal protein L25